VARNHYTCRRIFRICYQIKGLEDCRTKEQQTRRKPNKGAPPIKDRGIKKNSTNGSNRVRSQTADNPYHCSGARWRIRGAYRLKQCRNRMKLFPEKPSSRVNRSAIRLRRQWRSERAREEEKSKMCRAEVLASVAFDRSFWGQDPAAARPVVYLLYIEKIITIDWPRVAHRHPITISHLDANFSLPLSFSPSLSLSLFVLGRLTLRSLFLFASLDITPPRMKGEALIFIIKLLLRLVSTLV